MESPIVKLNITTMVFWIWKHICFKHDVYFYLDGAQLFLYYISRTHSGDTYHSRMSSLMMSSSLRSLFSLCNQAVCQEATHWEIAGCSQTLAAVANALAWAVTEHNKTIYLNWLYLKLRDLKKSQHMDTFVK